MSHRWEHEDEYLELKSKWRRAKKEGNEALCQQIQPRIQELDNLMWKAMIVGLPELAPYQSVVEALEEMAIRLDVPFPDLTNERNNTGDGKFIFGISDDFRTVQIFPSEDQGHYFLEVYDYERGAACYQGKTASLEEATIVLSRWFVERCSIAVLHDQYPWMADQPFKLSGPRMTLE